MCARACVSLNTQYVLRGAVVIFYSVLFRSPYLHASLLKEGMGLGGGGGGGGVEWEHTTVQVTEPASKMVP